MRVERFIINVNVKGNIFAADFHVFPQKRDGKSVGFKNDVWRMV